MDLLHALFYEGKTNRRAVPVEESEGDALCKRHLPQRNELLDRASRYRYAPAMLSPQGVASVDQSDPTRDSYETADWSSVMVEEEPRRLPKKARR